MIYSWSASRFLPNEVVNEVGEVSPSYGDGGVMAFFAKEHDPSVRFAATSPRRGVGRGRS